MPDNISLTLDNPDFRLEKSEHGGRYTVHFNTEGVQVAVQLSAATFDALLRQGQALVPHPETCLSMPEVEQAWRESAWGLRKLSDRDWRILLREVQSDSLIVLLWYLKDREIAKAVMQNCSERAAAMLTDDLVSAYEGRDPDAADAKKLEGARAELARVLDLVQRLTDEGQIEGFPQ